MLSNLLGNNSRLAFISLASLRSHVLRQPLLTALTTGVIALSVSLVVALGLSARSVEATLGRSADALAGHSDLEVTAGAVGIPEHVLEEVSSLPSIATAAPVMEAVVSFSGGPEDRRPLRILGVDLLADRSVRDYTVIQSDLRVLDPLRLIAKGDSVIISERLAHRLHLSDGDTLAVRSSLGEHRLVVRGLLAAGGMGDAYAGQIAIMDVYALQALLSRQGWLDRIDLVLKPGSNLEEAKAQVTEKLGGVAAVRQPNARNQLASAAISAITFLASLVALAGTLVASLLCYAALAASVDRRSRLFALFRAAGLEANRIHRLVYLDSLAVGLAGVVLGLPLGLWLSRIFSGVFSRTSSSYLSGVKIESVPISFGVLCLGAFVGIGVSQLSALVAARRSTRIPPHEAIAGGRGLGLEEGDAPSGHARAWSVLALTLWIVVWAAPLPIEPAYRAFIVLPLSVALLWMGIGPLLARVLPPIGRTIERLTPGFGRVAIGSLLLRLNQTRIASASIAALVATTASLWIVLTSLAETIDRSISLKGALVVVSADFPGVRIDMPLREDTVRAVATTPGVDAVFRLYASDTLFRDETVRLTAFDSAVWAERIGFTLRERKANDRETLKELQQGGVIISESFQRHFGVKLGDLIRLNTPAGPRDFPVVGIEVRYNAGSAGGLRMDLATFDRYWPRPGSSTLLVWASGDERVVEDAMRSGAGRLQELLFEPSREAERTARKVLDRYSRPVYGLLGLIALLAGSAVANLLMSSANELRGDMALLKCLGASRARLIRLVLIESCIVGLAGVIPGFALAMALAVPIRAVLADQFGWLISWSIRPEELALLAFGTVGASMLIGFATGSRIRRTISWNALTPE